MIDTAIKPGDLVVLGPENGLGCSPFLVLKVTSDLLRPLHVRDCNGHNWWARAEGTKVISPVQSCFGSR